jgi:hypothetical protein
MTVGEAMGAVNGSAFEVVWRDIDPHRRRRPSRQSRLEVFLGLAWFGATVE